MLVIVCNLKVLNTIEALPVYSSQAFGFFFMNLKRVKVMLKPKGLYEKPLFMSGILKIYIYDYDKKNPSRLYNR